MEQLSTRALCSLDDVKQYVNLSDEVDEDELLIRLINSASEAIYTITDREFLPIGSNPQTRTFDATEVYANGFLYLGDFTDIDSVSIYDDYDNLVETMDMDDVISLPRNLKPWEPYQAIKLRHQALQSNYYLDVTGTWGFPSVPEEIRQAVIVTVSIWHARDIADFSGTFSIAEDRVELPQTLPPAVSDTISRYQILPVA